MPSFSPLQRRRLQYQPPLPDLLQDVSLLKASSLEQPLSTDASLQTLFPHTKEQPLLLFKREGKASFRPLKVGVVLSGGQAPGGHTVIAGLWDGLKKMDAASTLIGFCNGPSGILKNQTLELTDSLLASFRNQGGFDLMGSGRTKIETPEQFEAAEKTVRALQLDGLVIIGGDDSNTNAAFLAEHFKSQGLATQVIGVPKTIDGDLKNAFIEVSFGFDTACKIYAEEIGNILKDALSAKKYYHFIKLMGRSASHIALECALQTHPNLTLIGEEIAAKKQTLKEVVGQMVDLICLRAEKGLHYGVILIPEGVIEFIPEFKTLTQGLDRDPHGNVQVSKIDTERFLIDLVEKELSLLKKEGKYAGQFSPQPQFCGYEGRAGLPSNFDCQYCYALGHAAALLLQAGATGYMSCVKNLSQPVTEWEVMGVPLYSMLALEEREGKSKVVIRKALVDLEGAAFALFAKQRQGWQLDDDYLCPGPIQFEGPAELTDTPPFSLTFKNKV